MLNVAVAVPIFPNVVQTYVLSELAAFRTTGVGFSVIAEVRPKNKLLPPIVDEFKLLDNTIYITTELSRLPLAIMSPYIYRSAYWRALRKLVRSDHLRHFGYGYLIKSLFRAQVLAFHPIDIIHSHSLISSYNYLFLKENFSIPLVTTYHGQVPHGVKKLGENKLQIVLAEGDAFIVNTEFARAELISMGCSGDKIHIIPQGLMINNFPYTERVIIPNRKIILLTVGRLSIEKGHHVMLEALRNLVKTFPMLEYHIVGTGPEYSHLSALADEYSLTDHVIFHGFKTGPELKTILAMAHIFILPSINTGDGFLVETQGVVLQEAQASGIPVIASRTGGIPEVIDHQKTGLLFDENDHAGLAECIKTLVTHPVAYHQLATAGRKDVESRFDIIYVNNEILQIFNRLIERRVR